MKRVLVIGGGLGGLSAAIRLAHAGFSVTLLEKENVVGGKLKEAVLGAYRFDVGPSTITMLKAFHQVFEKVGRRLEDYLDIYPIDPLTRNVFADGTIVDWTSDPQKMEEQIALYSPEDARHYKAFMNESRRLYEISESRFLNHLFISWKDKLSPHLLRDFSRIHPLTRLDSFLRRYFSHPHTLAMFGRYATYVGASPYRAPAIYAMMAHLESGLGIYGVKGGTYGIVKAYEQVAKELGVEIVTGVTARRILNKNKRVQGVESTEKVVYEADYVVANLDTLTAYHLLDESERPSMTNRQLETFEPSLSGFVVLAGVKKRFPLLHHHTVFFPDNYQAEFDAIFKEKRPPHDPTLYLCFSGYSDPLQAPPDASNLFILANAPYLSDAFEWRNEKERYAERLLMQLENKGLSDLTTNMAVKQIVTPEDWERNTGAHRGAIYGISSNRFKQAFFRPENRSKDVNGLWFVGGTTHPGGGTPIVSLSGQLVAEAIINECT